MSKRHAKPTAEVIANRIYRHLLEFRKDIENQLALIRLDMQVMHARCDKQDEQLDRLIGLMQQFVDRDRKLRALAEANRFMAGEPMRRVVMEPLGPSVVPGTYTARLIER